MNIIQSGNSYENTASNSPKYKCLTTFALKIIALIAMTIDHTGHVIGTDRYNGMVFLSGIIPEDIYLILRAIGRMAFPIYCYLIVEGFFHTRSVTKYSLRLFIFALISQVPYSLASSKELLDFKHPNVFFTLTLGLICVAAIDKCIEIFKESDKPNAVILIPGALITLLLMYVADKINTDYGILGIIIIVSFYLFKDKYIYLFIVIGCATNVLEPGIQMLSLFSLIPIFLHNHKKGPGLKYLFYIYYPAHLLVLYFIFTRMI